MRTLPPGYIANFDSAAAMLRATARVLAGKDFPALGLPLARPLKGVVPAVNLLPQKARDAVYAVGGVGEALGPRAIGKVRAEHIAQWAVELYPRRRYPAIFLGSSNGALVHLCAALGTPWLPQTVLVPVRQIDVHPDEPRDGLEAGREPGRILLENNPELQLHHMHDPNQDRLMLDLMTYFRVKWRRLSPSYARFIEDSLQPGGTIVLVDCQRRWPTTRVGERHLFQFGALGGITAEEFHHGSERVADYLARYGSHRRKWDPPAPDGDSPEAEWGFEPALREDVERLAARRGFKIARLAFTEPEDFSPFVADLYRWWYRQRRMRANRLLVESFILLEPYWALRTGSVPYWMKFNTEVSLEEVESYLGQAEPYDDIHMMLFSHGTESAGLVGIERWREVLARARRHGDFVGVDAKKYPRDFATFARYHSDVQKIPSRYPLPGPMALEQLGEFVSGSEGRYAIQWEGLEKLVQPTGLRAAAE
jgi:hypothetical protein